MNRDGSFQHRLSPEDSQRGSTASSTGKRERGWWWNKENLGPADHPTADVSVTLSSGLFLNHELQAVRGHWIRQEHRDQLAVSCDGSKRVSASVLVSFLPQQANLLCVDENFRV